MKKGTELQLPNQENIAQADNLQDVTKQLNCLIEILIEKRLLKRVDIDKLLKSVK